MQTIHELAGLARATGSLWLRRLPSIGGWFCFAWLGRELALTVSVVLGERLVASTLFLVLGMLLWVVGIVMMLHSIGDEVDTLTVAGAGTITERLSARRLLLEALVPFLALYAVWGLTEEQVQNAFNANIAYHGLDVSKFSITFAAWSLYLTIAVITWVLQAALTPLLSRRPGVLLSVIMIFLRGASLLTAFMGVSQLLVKVHNWALGREFYYWAYDLWLALLDALPQWQLPWNLTLPESVRAAASYLWDHLTPGLMEEVLLPLVWLALTAMVFGWADLGRQVKAGRLASRLSESAGRLGETRLGSKVATASSLSPLGLLRGWAVDQAEPLRPAIQAFRMILRSGWGFIGAFLVLGAFIRAISTWVTNGFMWLMGPHNFADTMVYLPFSNLLGEFFSWTLAAAYYVVAFDRARARMVLQGLAPPDPCFVADPVASATTREG